ncbi:ABC transporter ATP-binding protein [Alicyclobacillus dauci]|uniref:ABC transporter ATP-binding protein n=1 Tax=Alicyclobacillus dauci TaxID=1475485 RepID=A0ABY6Z056_9BACL|nr:ABC transporter ATP-binding protein [Alicyclobacillus dauci]WAH36099.1 ABC transporter ATP-binding protein [Alicyclobacillus dauci]
MHIVQLKDVSWRRNGTHILDNIHWTINKGEHWSLIGLNGSGKTSLLNLINGYQWPTTGSIEVLGNQFGKTDLRALRKRIGWVSAAMGQRIERDKPHDSALEVVISGKYGSVGVWTFADGDEAEALEQLERLGCASLADKSLNVLSQGERQKVFIARALMANPDLLILDEPCTGLDLYARESLLSAIQEFTTQANGPTLIFVSHHAEEIVPGITHTMVLKNGSVVAQGEKHSVLTADVLSNAFQLPVHVDWQDDRAWLRVASEAAVK